MIYIPDLARYEYSPTSHELLAIGWLDPDHGFAQGQVPSALVARLALLAAEHAVNRTRGVHRCNLCTPVPVEDVAHRRHPISVEVAGRKLTLGGAEIWIEDQRGQKYAAPDLILHYVTEHGYHPPQVFIEAVLSGQPLSP